MMCKVARGSVEWMRQENQRTMFKKVLIANRGEIAVRIAQTLQEMGIAAVAVFSEADRTSRHVAAADEAYELPGMTAAESYLDAHALIEAAQHHEVDAVHPGYGFLSENAGFARACAEAGLTFIGPTSEVIAAMGDKIVAKQTLAAAGVPMLPGWSGAADAPLKELERAADEIGYPVLLKAAAGGGGKGMRIVREAGELEAALGAAQREAKSAFGDARVFLEKYLERPRHIEFQIFGDTHGTVVHLFERECSIQRRHQKIVEESPAPGLSSALREEMGAAAARAAKALNYTNAGTIEFLVDDAGAYYFLEVNTRLQVEHPVTELVVDEDLVRLQVQVAAGEPLPFAQADVRQRGHAMEVRIYAEDPARGFLPSTGRIDSYREPQGRGVRVDGGVGAGTEVGVHYDPMLAKLIVCGADREDARQRLRWALRRYVVLGVTTNIGFLADLVDHPAFVRGETHTQFIDEHGLLDAAADVTIEPAALIAAAFAVKQGVGVSAARVVREGGSVEVDPWAAGQRWRNA
jgi:3-methylcrotonyl-CoA carboxylase alpha subunit